MRSTGVRSAGSRWQWTAAVLISAIPFAAEGATNYGDIDVSVTSAQDVRSTHGYAEYRFTITNHSETTAHRVRLNAGRQAGGGNYIRQLSRSVRVEPTSSLVVSLFQPPLPILGDRVEVTIDGRVQRGRMSIGTNSHCSQRYGYGGGGNWCYVLLSRSINHGDFQVAAEKWLKPTSPTGHSGYSGPRDWHQFVRADQPVDAWTPNWLGHSRYDGIVVSGGDLRTMPGAPKSALLRYVECGGSLVIIGTPPPWLNRWPKEQGTGGSQVYSVGFGQCAVIDEANIRRWAGPFWRSLQAMWMASAHPWTQVRSVSNANKAFPIVGKLRMPVRGFFVLMLIFAVTIGPVNIFLLSRRKKLIWLLFTVPVISIVFCAALFAYSVAAEGWRATVRTEGLTLLDERTHHATTIGWTGYYCPLTPGGGLRFGYDTELTPQVETKRWRNEGRPRTIDWTNEQHLAAGWVTARIPAHFMVRKSQLFRGRLSVSKNDDGSLSVTNGLGVDIVSLHLADKEGKLFRASHVKKGSKLPLRSSKKVIATGGGSPLRKIFSSAWLGLPDLCTSNPERYLRPGSYIALISEAPFIEQGGVTQKQRKASMAIYGIMKEVVDGS